MPRNRDLIVVLCLSVLLLGCGRGFTAEQGGARFIVSFRPSAREVPAGDRATLLRMLQTQTRKAWEGLRVPVSKGSRPRWLWAAQAVAATLTPGEVQAIRARPEVVEVVPVTYQIWAPPLESLPVLGPALASEPLNHWGIDRTGAPRVWKELHIDGSGVLVGHLDSGLNAGHPALAGQVAGFRDYTVDPAGVATAPYDDQGHGTHTAGTIAGRADAIGMAPGAMLLAARVLDTDGGGFNESIMAAMQWMLDPDGDPATDDAPRVVNNSWGSSSTSDRLFWAITETWVKAGIVPVFSAGNNGYDNGKVGVPAAFPHVLGVGASDATDGWAWFSSLGPARWEGKTYVKPDVAAPGMKIVSAGFRGGLVANSGTSMAGPHVTGLVALLTQANPRLTPAQVMALVHETAVDLGDPGADDKFGHGRIDAFAAVGKALASVSAVDRLQACAAGLADSVSSPDVRERQLRGLMAWGTSLDEETFASLSRAGTGSVREQQVLRLLGTVRRFHRLHREAPSAR